MSQRPVSYAGKRIAPSRRSAPPRKAPSRPAPRPDRTKSAAAPVPGARRRMVQLVISAALLLALLRASREAIGGVTAGLCLINLIPIFVCIAKTESALKKRFPD